MRVLVIGSGGREHTIVWKLAQSPRVQAIVCAPGNAGMERIAKNVRVPPTDFAAISDLVRSERIDYVVVGPEAPLSAGLVDHLKACGIPVVGPTQKAAQLESSKVFSKDFMSRHNVPTARYATYQDAKSAIAFLESSEAAFPIVVKADGLAAGKGVVVARNLAEARDAVLRMMVEKEFGAAGDRILIEECLKGVEASYIVFTDGDTIVPAVAARDHKAVFDNDEGPNTGGMGAYSTDNILGPELEREVLQRVIRPVIEGMKSEGNPFQGILYAGLMLTDRGVQVLEFNVRMGDPECQVILPRLKSDFSDLCEALCQGRLKDYKAVWNSDAAVCVVLASGGYPGPYVKGKAISGLGMAEENQRVAVFHAGTRKEGEQFLTDGGRVLGVTATEKDLASAMMLAYEAVNKIHFDGMHYRRDIGAKGLASADQKSL
ncbi:MAG: phosphoribosylamine--glycine ligase [Acidobacteriota bacterium]|jgi:phosphoribosylamine--glycine ligase|nr:phosphoribosylamine--glycine ligase [Acidobacteriota bacterium]